MTGTAASSPLGLLCVCGSRWRTQRPIVTAGEDAGAGVDLLLLPLPPSPPHRRSRILLHADRRRTAAMPEGNCVFIRLTLMSTVLFLLLLAKNPQTMF